MARKPRNREYEESIIRVIQANKNEQFVMALESFEANWANRGYPNIDGEGIVDWDDNQHQKIYRGLYYDLRDLCDRSNLFWPMDANVILRGLYAFKVSDDQIKPSKDIPSKREWQWFRMARTGLDLPRKDEISQIQGKGMGGFSHRKTIRTFEDGITNEIIAGWAEVTDRTVRNSISRCWRYLQGGGINLNQVAELAELEAWELPLLATASLFREWQKRKNKS